MCVGCMSHLLADARLKDESATCPNCRCEISKTVCSRNLAVEKAVSELPTECKFCSQQLPRNVLDHHERHLCTERCVYDSATFQQASPSNWIIFVCFLIAEPINGRQGFNDPDPLQCSLHSVAVPCRARASRSVFSRTVQTYHNNIQNVFAT